MSKDLPFCSVIVLNYFGERVIESTIDSLLNLTYPQNKYEIIIVDNASKDKSKKIILNYAKKNKNIRSIFLNKNLGFAGGNNRGIKAAKGKYVVLLNNDCLVDKNWLDELVKTAERNKNVFSVNSKILLYPKYFFLKVKGPKKTIVEKFYLHKSALLKFVRWKRLALNLEIKKNYYQLEIPYDSIYDKTIEITLIFKRIVLKKKYRPSKMRLLNIEKNSYQILQEKYIKNRLVYKIKLTPLFNSFDKIQNAGIVVFQGGSGRDIGSVIRYQAQNYEKNSGQYDEEKEVYASCGAASLYRKDILDKIGYLDDSFFMYYEDVEICERARLNGYKILYCPTAVVRHLHALSSKEWSPFFIYHTEKGRLLHVLYHFPLGIFLLEYFKFSIKNLAKLVRRSKTVKEVTINLQYIKVIFYFLFKFPLLVLKRFQKYENISKDLIVENYKKIKEGYWYFN